MLFPHEEPPLHFLDSKFLEINEGVQEKEGEGTAKKYRKKKTSRFLELNSKNLEVSRERVKGSQKNAQRSGCSSLSFQRVAVTIEHSADFGLFKRVDAFGQGFLLFVCQGAAHTVRQRGGGDGIIFAQKGRIFHHVAQLAHVAGPSIALQGVYGVGADGETAVVFAVETCKDILHDDWDVCAASAQGDEPAP